MKEFWKIFIAEWKESSKDPIAYQIKQAAIKKEEKEEEILAEKNGNHTVKNVITTAAALAAANWISDKIVGDFGKNFKA